jgi:nitrogen fixation protein FixH
MSASGGNGAAPSRDLWIPWLIVAGFAVIILVNGVMVYFAMTSFTGLHTEGHYQRGLDYNDVLASQAAEEKLGWTVEVDFAETGREQIRLSVRAADRAGNPLNDAGVQVRLVRPVQAGHDMNVTLAAAGDGLYSAEIKLPLRGQWDILAQISHPSGNYSTATRIVAQ